MSSNPVEVCRIEAKQKHPRRDRLDLIQVKGWQAIVGLDQFQVGELVVFVPPDSVLEEKFAEEKGVRNYLKERLGDDGKKHLVVGQIKLGGEPSFGLVIPADPEWTEGLDVSKILGIEKFVPPARRVSMKGQGKARIRKHENPEFHKFTDIEHFKNYNKIFEEGEIVVVTEKIHGSNFRVGLSSSFLFRILGEEFHLRHFGKKWWNFAFSGNVLIGSRQVQRDFQGLTDHRPCSYRDWDSFEYHLPLKDSRVIRCLLAEIFKFGRKTAILYGEIFGPKIQKGFDYGRTETDYAAFDMKIDGEWVDANDFLDRQRTFRFKVVPLLYCGRFSKSILKHSEGETLAGGKHIREGCVIRPVRERIDPKLGRVILKVVGDGFTFRKGREEQDTTDI